MEILHLLLKIFIIGILGRETSSQWTWEPLHKFNFDSNKPHFDTGFRKLYVCRVNETNFGGDVLSANVGYYEHPASAPDRNKCFFVGSLELKELHEESDHSKIEILNFSDNLKWVWIKNQDLKSYIPKMVPAGVFQFENQDRYVCRAPTKLKCGKPRPLEASDFIGRVYPSAKQYGDYCMGIYNRTGVFTFPQYEVLVAGG